MQGGAGPKASDFLQPHNLRHRPGTTHQPLQPCRALAATSSRSSGKAITAGPNVPLLVQKLNFKAVDSNSPGEHQRVEGGQQEGGFSY